MPADPAAEALLELMAELDRRGYDFVPPTPATHRRVVKRPDMAVARDLRGVFGWSLPCAPELLPPPLLDLLERAGALRRAGALLRSGLRAARIHGRLFLHSPFPTEERDAVFFGPDSYRFADFVRAELPRASGARRLVDLGAGAGVGGILASPLVPDARITLVDINPKALRLAAINARHAGVEVELVGGGSIEDVADAVDLVIANPPYMVDDAGRSYRDGGSMHGAALSLDWALSAARRLDPGGRMLLYTGAAIVEGRDCLREALAQALPDLGCALSYREIDPDVFGEELERPAYADVERIAAIGAVIEKF